MPRIPPVTTAGLDDITRRRRHREVTDLMLHFQHDDSRIRTAAEIAAGVTPVNYAYAPYVRGRYASFADWKLACDQADAEGSLETDYTLTADITLPNRCHFKGYQLTGAFYSTHELVSNGWVKNWQAKQPRIRGCFYCKYTEINTGSDDTGFIEVWGGNGSSNPGTFWCKIGIAYTRTLTIDASNFDINQNRFSGGIARYVHLTGGSGGSGQIHANTFSGIDATKNGSGSTWGFLQDDAALCVNYLIGCYYESGSDAVGNFHIGVAGMQVDGNSPPKIGRYQHLMGSVGINAKARGDYLSLSCFNFAEGGLWDVVDSNNKPPSLSQASGTGAAVVADTTTPGGIGKRYVVTMAADQGRFGITFDTNGQSYFTAVIDYKSTRDFVTILSNDGSSDTFYDQAPASIDMPTNWKRLRISGPANTAGTTTIKLYAANGAAISSTDFSIGGFFVGTERAIPAPSRVPYVESGSFTATLTGVSGTVQAAAYYVKQRNQVTLQIDTLSGTSTAATCTITGLPATLNPARTQGNQLVSVQDNSVQAVGVVQMATTGVINCFKSITATGSDWTAANTKAIGNFNYTYLLT